MAGTEAMLLKLLSPSSILASSFELKVTFDDIRLPEPIMTEGPINFLSNQEIWTDLVRTSVARFPKPSICEGLV